jgi:hypothetical protein
LKDIDKVHVLQSNNAYTLVICGNVKRILRDCVGALENLDKAHVFKPNNAYIFMFHRDVKSNLKDYVGAV